MMHIKCRNSLYPSSLIRRLKVEDSKVSWEIPWLDYKPVVHPDVVTGKPWADPDITEENFQPKWNALDGNVNRKSYIGEYLIVDKYPLNPEGRTGLRGRGLLGRWGPNHAADPIVTRWKRQNDKIQFNSESKLPILQVCVIQRRDCNEWALPGGMVDPGEQVSVTLKREFMEEALNSLESNTDQKAKVEDMMNQYFSSGVDIYKGYVDDPRNTDNAWMETVAVNFHDANGNNFGKFSLKAGDDAKNVKWLDIGKDILLYASHSKLIEKVVELRQAHW